MRDRVQRAIDFAVSKEIEAEAFYKEWAVKVAGPGTKAVLAELAAAENGHAEMLRRLRPEEIIGKGMDETADPGLIDYLVDIEADSSMDLRHAMILAMKREATSVALYERLAEFGGETEALFRALAREERRHRQKLEAEYDQYILTESK